MRGGGSGHEAAHVYTGRGDELGEGGSGSAEKKRMGLLSPRLQNLLLGEPGGSTAVPSSTPSEVQDDTEHARPYFSAGNDDVSSGEGVGNVRLGGSKVSEVLQQIETHQPKDSLNAMTGNGGGLGLLSPRLQSVLRCGGATQFRVRAVRARGR